jgi:hypothetical protein
MRKEVIKRLTVKLFNPDWGTMDLKFWLPLNKKKFLDFTY